MKNIIIYLGMIAIMLQAGCGTMFEAEHTTPDFGSSVRGIMLSQTANPEAGQDDAPVVGLDGRYAAKVAENYNKGPRDKTERNRPSMFGVVDTKL
ncbi:hypothetical protein LF599_03290 [Pseudodesulfovibrio thermohalotolerans]|uniref:hypothetical protein n=1 Tax=Pseudodesulfovibrio thermohalotolerans TaxID=2880651 RepID=UPI0024414350|nr:hypothetical protein [Pseudodesulfovibrio thermohalotolerans]WFS63202.1 hypothetical protein LF599_03290 [Pseudodesulfovibrio thermohalotolerans]